MGFFDWLAGKSPEPEDSWDWTTDEADALENLSENEAARNGDDGLFTYEEQNRLGFLKFLFGGNGDKA